jgi:hypothetical protein
MLRARDARTMTPPKLAEFVLSHMEGEKQLDSKELALSSISDVRAYQSLTGLALAMSSDSRRLQLSAAAVAKGFSVKLGDTNEPEGSLIAGRSFTIERRNASPEKS